MVEVVVEVVVVVGVDGDAEVPFSRTLMKSIEPFKKVGAVAVC